jgi:O-acetyl-ADP-ribose deacetylase (regulator of RNase III)
MREWAVGSGFVELVQGDITAIETDAIVNAANSGLAGGGGVDGAIHRAGGPAIMQELRTRYPDGCPTGSAVVTGAGKLKARWLIHTVAPVWQGGNQGEAALLRDAYASALARAVEVGAKRIAFPSLGTGIYGNPVGPSAIIALDEAVRHLRTGQEPLTVSFVLFDNPTLAAFEAALQEISGRWARAEG